jgi:hypothetical protein
VGSLFTLLLAALSIGSLFMETTKPQPPNSAQFVIVSAVMITLLGALGIWTAVGLFRMRSWARTSIVIFAGFLAATSLFSLLLTMAIPIPPEFSAGTGQIFRRVMAGMFGIPLAIAVWWLVQFNTQSTKAAFASPIDEDASMTPLSITIIGWLTLFGSASSLLFVLLRVPAFLFGASFTGWSAGAIYLLFAALSVYIGKGLLDLREQARIVAIGWFAFGFIHLSFVTLVPSVRERLFAVQRTLEANQPNPIPLDQGMMMNVILGFSALLAVAAIWFLIRNRAAFVRTASL